MDRGIDEQQSIPTWFALLCFQVRNPKEKSFLRHCLISLAHTMGQRQALQSRLSQFYSIHGLF